MPINIHDLITTIDRRIDQKLLQFKKGASAMPSMLHALLSGTHSDTVVSTPAVGDLMAHNGTAWESKTTPVSGFIARAQVTPDLTVRVSAGRIVLHGVNTVIAATNSPANAGPPINYSRTDLLFIDRIGNLNWQPGANVTPPVKPSLDLGNAILPICYVTWLEGHVAGFYIEQSQIEDIRFTFNTSNVIAYGGVADQLTKWSGDNEITRVGAGTGYLHSDGSGTYTWASPGGGGIGDVIGPASAVDNDLVAFNLTTGKLVKDSGVLTSDVSSAVSLKHTQGTDTALGTLGTKNPPIDADLMIYRNSAASNVLVTSTFTQVKAFLKTYFDTLYSGGATSGEVLMADGITPPDPLLLEDSTDWCYEG